MRSDNGQYFVEGDSRESNLLRWLAKGAGSDSRPVLSGLHITPHYTATADGFRMMASPTPRSLAPLHKAQVLAEGMPDDSDKDNYRSIASWRFEKIPAGDFVTRAEPVEGVYPDLESIIPRREPKAHVTINLEFLADLYRYGHKGHVTLVLREPNDPVECLIHFRGKDPEGVPSDRYALIMPMNDKRVRGKKPLEDHWRPVTPDERVGDVDLAHDLAKREHAELLRAELEVKLEREPVDKPASFQDREGNTYTEKPKTPQVEPEWDTGVYSGAGNILKRDS